MPQPTSAASAREIFERALQSILDRRMDIYADLFAGDAVFELPFAPSGVPRRIEGQEAIRTFLQAGADRLRAAPQWQFRSIVVHETLNPEVIVTEFEVHVVNAETPYQFSNLQVMTVRDGKFVSLRDYWNPLDRRELAALVNQTTTPLQQD
jgi:ketosteroid isomerase-like protein